MPGCGYLEEAVDIGLGSGVAQPGAEQGAQLEGIAEVGLGVEGHFDLDQGRVGIIAPQEVSPTEMGAGVAHIKVQGAGEVGLGACSISRQAGVPALPAESDRSGRRLGSPRRRLAQLRHGGRDGRVRRPAPPRCSGSADRGR